MTAITALCRKVSSPGLLAALALTAVLSTASTARAWNSCGGYDFQNWGGPFGAGFFGFSSPYAMGRIPTPPYFALHPPVYYNIPVARTYGYSPFAYPGTVPTPEVEIEATPQVIINPHVQPTAAEPQTGTAPDPSDSAARQQTDRSLWIINPYVDVDAAAPRRSERLAEKNGLGALAESR